MVEKAGAAIIIVTRSRLSGSCHDCAFQFGHGCSGRSQSSDFLYFLPVIPTIHSCRWISLHPLTSFSCCRGNHCGQRSTVHPFSRIVAVTHLQARVTIFSPDYNASRPTWKASFTAKRKQQVREAHRRSCRYVDPKLCILAPDIANPSSPLTSLPSLTLPHYTHLNTIPRAAANLPPPSPLSSIQPSHQNSKPSSLPTLHHQPPSHPMTPTLSSPTPPATLTASMRASNTARLFPLPRRARLRETQRSMDWLRGCGMFV